MDSCWRCRTLRQDDAHVCSVPSDARLRYDDEPERDPDADAVRRASGAGRGRRKAVLVLGSLRALPPDGWRVRVGCGALDSRPARQVRGHASPASRPRQSRPPRPAGSASTPATRPATSTAPARPEEASVAPSFPREGGPPTRAPAGASGRQSGSGRGPSLAWKSDRAPARCRDDRGVAHMEECLSRGRGCCPLSGWWFLLWSQACGAIRGFATLVMLIFAGLGTPRPLFVARPPSKVG
jgi:hypothetical protein